MEVDDFVETSDVEELQELEEEVKTMEVKTMLSSARQRHDSFNSYSPRKRVKVRLVVRVFSFSNLHFISSCIMVL
jgi:hypothetical protein